MYLKLENGNIRYPYTISELKSENPNTSFPAVLTNEVLESFDVYYVETTDYTDDYTKNIEEGTPILSESSYIQVWNKTDATEEEISAKLEEKWVEVRIMRDALLAQSDWTQFQDSPLSGTNLTDWQTYRQSLRDISSQSNPYNLTWPVKPM
tara:strand:+ start:1902 stop:2354 length:453 start_codon:yes stop_codon:yes gene_type:complete